MPTSITLMFLDRNQRQAMASVAIPSWALVAAAALVAISTVVVVYRRYFHPLAKVPGPFLWAVSPLPILYHQGLREGNLVNELFRLHAIYGCRPSLSLSPISTQASY